MSDLRALKRDDFAPHVGTTFRIRMGDEVVDAELIDVIGRRGDTVEEAQRSPFSVVFRVPTEALIEQQTFRIEHQAMGTLELFLVPVGPDKVGMCYEAVFS